MQRLSTADADFEARFTRLVEEGGSGAQVVVAPWYDDADA